MKLSLFPPNYKGVEFTSRSSHPSWSPSAETFKANCTNSIVSNSPFMPGFYALMSPARSRTSQKVNWPKVVNELLRTELWKINMARWRIVPHSKHTAMFMHWFAPQTYCVVIAPLKTLHAGPCFTSTTLNRGHVKALFRVWLWADSVSKL